jgi:phosphotriesterase-related protein
MRKINTVLGPILPQDLGTTLVHEHIAASYPGWECDSLSRPYEREKMIQKGLRVIEPVKAYGVKSIIDATPSDLARDVDIMKAVSEKLEINIICSTGRYTEEEGKWAYLKTRSNAGVGDMKTELYESMMNEVTNGIGSSGIKPGAIKVASGLNRITRLEEALFQAAARTSKETGLPIITHTQDGTMGPEQANLLISEGVSPSNIMIGHMCGNPSLQYQIDVLKTGANVAFDRFGLELFVPDEIRTAVLIGLVGIGYADRIMLSQDFIAVSFGRGGKLPEDRLKQLTNWSFVNIFKNIIPALKMAGVTESQINTMLVDNPRRLLSGS